MQEEPDNQILRFNHAFVSMKFASDQIGNENSRLDDVKQAIQMLETAGELFRQISSMSAEKIQPYRYLSRTQCGDLARQCTDVLRQSEEFLGRAEVNIDFVLRIYYLAKISFVTYHPKLIEFTENSSGGTPKPRDS